MFNNEHSAYRKKSYYISKYKILHKIFQKQLNVKNVRMTSAIPLCCKTESRVLHKGMKSHIAKKYSEKIIDFNFGRNKD